MKRATHGYIDAILRNKISIHALVKRATQFSTSSTTDRMNFNPRPREEGDIAVMIFIGSHKDFNPRPREEGDGVTVTPERFGGISIHALVKRATPHRSVCTLYPLFQSTPS